MTSNFVPQLFQEEFFEQNKIDSLYIVSNEQLVDPLLCKLTGITQLNFGYRFLQTAEKNLLLCSPLEARSVGKQYRGRMKIIRSHKDIYKNLHAFFDKKRVGLNHAYMTAGQLLALKEKFPKTKFIDVSNALYQSRGIKTKEEIKKISEAAHISQEVSHQFPEWVHKNITEQQLMARINYEFARNACEEAFPTLVCFGDNARDIHHFVSNKKLKKNETILIDFGAKHEGYCSDLSRTMHFGKASEGKHAFYAKTFEAQEAGIAELVPGNPSKKAHLAAEKVLGHKIPHGLGHGVGLETHDSPGVISPYQEWKVSPGMVLAVEPGYYGSSGGIRIEDNIVITHGGNKRLSKAPKHLIEV